MASAPIVVSRQQFGPLQTVPQLPAGEDVARARLTGAAVLFNNTIAGAQQVATAETGALQRDFQTDVTGAREEGAASAASGVAQARLGQAVQQALPTIVERIVEGNLVTRMNEDLVEWQQKGEALRDKTTNDPDWQGASKRYLEEKQQISGDILGRYSGQARSEMALRMSRFWLSIDRDVRQRELDKTRDAAIASEDTLSAGRAQRAARVQSPEERAMILSENKASLARMVKSGWMSEQEAVRRDQVFNQQLDAADIARGVRERPAVTLAALDDPNMFRSLTPTQREAAKAQAQAANDEQQGLRAQNKAKHDPVAAVGMTGRTADPAMTQTIFDRVIVAQESSGRADAVSVQGALGKSQLMPGTARAQAKRMGISLPDDDAALRRVLLDPNNDTNIRLGRGFWSYLVNRYDGNVYAAAGAYHAGEGSMDSWHKAAVARFGDNYSPNQLREIIGAGNPKTQKYVLDIAARLGADPGGMGVSVAASYRIANLVDGELTSQNAARKRNVDALISASSDERDAVITQFKSGYASDPGQIAAVKAPLIAAAASGDVGAAVKLRNFEQVEALAPVVRQAYQMTPEALEAGVAQLRAEVARGAASAGEIQRLEVFTGVQQQVAQLRKTDPIQLEERAGRASVTAVAPPQDPRSPEWAEQLAVRATVAQRAMERYGAPAGGSMILLKPEETVAMKARFAQAVPAERAAMLRTAAVAMPETAYRGFVGQVVGDDAVSRTAGLLGRRDPQLAADILEGQELLRQEGVKTKAADVTAALRSALPARIFPSSDMQSDVIDAALAVYAVDRQRSGSLFDASDAAGLERAIARVAGTVTKVNGGYTVAPAGQENLLKNAWRGLDDAALQHFGGAVDAGGKPLDAGFLASHARLRPFGPQDNRYVVYLPGVGDQDRAVMTATPGVPLTVDLPNLARLANLAEGRRLISEGTLGPFGFPVVNRQPELQP